METMSDLYNAAFSPVNLPYSILMIFISVYWMLVIIGLLDIDLFDLDLDTDADLDVDGDLGDVGGFSVLSFLNIGEAPVIEQIKSVSIKTPIIPISACCPGLSVFAAAWAIGAEPSPASFENTPLATPNLKASLIAAPANPPTAAVG